jgi:subtilisin family serine protease
VSPGAGLVVGPFLEQTKYHISDTIDGIRKCRDKGAKVVNMSYGPTALRECRGGNFFSQIENYFINGFTVNDNMLLVAAAGNHGACAGANANALGYPASYTNVLSVASVDSDGRRAFDSAKNNQVNIAAPGVNVDSTANNGGYTRMSGTSMASPHVAGIAARVWSIMPWLTALQLRSFLTSAAQYEYQSFTGAGLVNHGFFTIMLQRSGKCLDNWGSTAKLYTCGYGYTDQMFTYDYFNNMIVGSDGKCLRSSGNYNGASVTFSACSKDDSAQKFSYNRSTKQFTNNGGYCFDNHGAYQFQNNGVVHMWSCHSGTNQKWLLGKDYETRLYQDSNMYAGGKMYRTPGAGRWGSMPTAINNDRLIGL